LIDKTMKRTGSRMLKRKLFCLGFAALLIGCGGEDTENASNPCFEGPQVGFAHVDITPTVPVMLAGYGAFFLSDDFCRWSTGVHDPLYARAMALEDPEGESLLIIVLDNVGTITNEVVEIQEGITRELGIQGKNVVVCSTHTHHGPDTIGFWGVLVPPKTGRQEDVMDEMVTGAVRVGVQAWHARTPARLAYGVGEESRVHVNKIFSDPNRVLDSTMTVLAAYDMNGRVIGSLMNWAAHPTLMSQANTLISTDFPGAYCRHMKEALGGEHIFLNGAIGASVQALAPEDGWLKWLLGNATWTDVDDMGKLLADDAVSFMAEAISIADPSIRLLRTDAIETEIENEFFWLFGQMGLVPRPVPPVGERIVTYATTFAIGPLTFGTIPGEFVPDYSFRMREIMGGGGAGNHRTWHGLGRLCHLARAIRESWIPL